MSSATPSLASLLSQATLADHEEYLRAANAALKTSKHDLRAQHTRVVALLKLDRYEDAVRAVEEGGDALKNAAGLEYSYGLYKTGKLTDAITTARDLEGRGARFVEAQALYRGEEFQDAQRVYQQLAQEKVGSEEGDLRINMKAVEAQLLWQGTSPSAEELQIDKVERKDLEAFETAFNSACVCVARTDLRQAEVLLKRAKELCKHLDDLSVEERKAELIPIAVQQLYVFIRLGKNQEAQDVAAEIGISE